MAKYTAELLEYLEKTKISCDVVDQLVTDLLDSELPLTLAGRIENHIDKCEHCQQEIADILFIIQEAKKCFPDVKIPEDVRYRLHQRLNHELGLNLS